MPKYKLSSGKFIIVKDNDVQDFLNSDIGKGATVVEEIAAPVVTEDYVKTPGVDFDDYLKPVKTEDSASADPTVESKDMGSKSVDGSLVYQEPTERDLLVFNIKETEKQINNYIEQGGEINKSDAKVLQDYKDKLAKLDEEFDVSTNKFEDLKEEEKIKLQELASKKIIDKYNKQGVKNFNITEDQIDQEAKKILKRKTQPGLIESYAAQTAKGFASFAKNSTEFVDMVEFSIMEGALNAFDPDYSGSKEQKQALMLAVESNLGLKPDATADFEKFITKLEPSIRQYESSSITDDIINGDYLQAGERAVGAALESLPSVVAAATGVGGLVALGASSAGGKFSEEFEKDPELGTTRLVANALATGTIEAGFELATRGVLKRAGILNNSGNKQAAEDLIRGGAESLIKGLGINTFTEAGSEAATKITTLLVDAIPEEYGGLGKKINWSKDWKNIADEAIVGAVFGSTATTAGAIKNANKDAVDAAENILMPNQVKKVLYDSANNLSKLYKDRELADAEGVELLDEVIKSEQRKIVKLKVENSRALQNMTAEEVKQYADNKTQIEKLSKEVKKPNQVESVKKIAEEKVEKLAEINKELYKESATRRLERDIEFTKKEAKDYDVNVIDNLTAKEIEDKFGKEYAESEGWFDGKNIYINKDIAKQTNAVTVGSHELLHRVIKDRVKKEGGKDVVKEFMSKLDKKQFEAIESRAKAIDADGNRIYTDEYLEANPDEYLTIFSDAILKKEIKFNENIVTKIKDFVLPIIRAIGFRKIKFESGRDVYNFMREYSKSVESGKLSKDIKEATIGDLKNKEEVFSKPIEQIQKEIEALENLYDEQNIDYYDFENRMDILEAELEKAKKAPKQTQPKPVKKSTQLSVQDIKDQIEQLDEDLYSGVIDDIDYEQRLDLLEEKLKQAKLRLSDPKKAQENQDKIVKQSVDKFKKEVSEETVSDKNKNIAKMNEDIANEMLELGANQVSDIKDPIKRKQIIDKLGKNNLGAVTNLTKRAAAAGKNLAIDDNLKIGYDEFFSGFSEELSALIKSYKVEVDGKKVPFGAYMNKNLPLRYGQILDNALKGRIEGSKSLDVQAGEKGFAGSIIADRSADFDAVTSAEMGLPVDDLIDVTTFRKVKDKVETIKESIDLTDVDLDNLTYRKIQDDYSGQVGAELIGMWDRNAEPEADQDRNDFQKLAERIEGTRTLNYGKDTGGEAEVRAMQGLFLDYNDAVKFIKTMPEFNVAPFETTIDEQGRSIDLTEDARGYSTGISNKLLKEFYEPYIDPKSKSSDKGTKSRAITSPSGRGKGKTSQVAKVYRLKPEYRGKISRQTVQDLQKTIGITPAGEAFIPMKGKNRTEFGTALQGLTKMYATNVANTIIRKKIVEEGLTSVAKPVEKLLADIGGGKSRVMFSKNVDNFDPSFNVSFSKNFNKSINDKFGFKSRYYELDPTSKNWPEQETRFLKDYENFVKNTSIGAFKPRFFISSKNTLNPNIKKTDKNYNLAYKRRKALRNKIRNVNKKYKLKNIGFVTPPNLYGKDVSSIESNIISGKVLQNNDKYSSLFDKTWLTIADLIRKDRGMIPFIGHFLETSGETDHWTRLGAPLVAYDIDPKSVDFVYLDKQGNKIKIKVNFEYEHAMPVNVAVKKLFEAAADPNVDFEQMLRDVKENYKLIALSAGDNYKLVKAKLASKMPRNWNVFWDRYFNKEVASIDGGINMDNIMLIETINEKPTITPLKDVLSINNDGSNTLFSKSRLDEEFNKIIENKTGILATDEISEVKAKMIANNKRRFNIFIPPSAEDFVGLLYATLGKGKVGEKQMMFYDRTLIRPYARAMQAITRDRIDLGRAFKDIRKEFKATPKDLKKKVPNSLFTKEQAVRIYIWDSIGKEVPGLSVDEVNELANYVADNKDLKDFAEQVMRLNPGSKYASPKETWTTGTITTDLLETLNESRRAKHLGRWQQNVDEIFSKENLNKLEAAYGTSYRKAMENMLTRMKTGRNRTYGTDSQTAKWIDWVNGSVGTIMFLNARSAVLQTISAANFINFGDNNVFAAGKAFANQKQYWSDFAFLMNSDYLVERRDSLKININEADIAEAAQKKGARGAINYLLKLGFTPTKFADSFAIASGGAAFYRNRLNALIKKGMDPVAAEKAAMRDFIEKSEESQQSSRPDKISQEQAGPLGRVILAFANTPAQYARIIKKAASDLKNRRGSDKENISKIIYYGLAQNLLFNALQQAIFAVAFGDEEDEGALDDKKLNIVNGMLDGIIRGTGVGGAIFTVVKNSGLRIYKESNKKRPNYESVVDEALKISPPISSKISKLKSAGRTFTWDAKEIKGKGLDITNPAVGASAKILSAGTNLPLDRVVRKIENLKAASDSELETYKRLALILGWGKWELGIKDEKWKAPKKKKKRFKERKVKERKVKERKITIR